MKKKGFTLIELMIAIAVFTIFSMYLYQTFFSQVKQSFNFNNNIDIQYNANKALNMITDQIRNYSFTNISVNGTKVLSGGKVIIDLDSTVVGTSNTDIILYYNGASKTLSDSSGNQCSNIDSIKIERGSNDENELMMVTISASQGERKITSSTAVNINK